MSASTRQTGRDGRSKAALHLWRSGGLVFLFVSLCALAAGAFIEHILPPHRYQALANPPTLQLLLSAQAGFLVMFCPLLHLRRRERGAGQALASAAGEYVWWVAVSVPLYVVAAYLADATVTDVIRGGLYLTAVASLTWGLGLWVRTGRTAIITAAVLAAALIAVGAPVAYYLLVELAGAADSVAWLWRLAPVTCAFDVAGARGAHWYPSPIWAWALWPTAAAALTFAFLLYGFREE